MLTKQSQFLTILQAWLDGVYMKALLEPIVLLRLKQELLIIYRATAMQKSTKLL
ncbi:hypothetical protein [Nostoc sp. DedQUE09]|uniref:hypothetical protein n=1 Tax=Nostoc sp. DedQUE09 TaxID=3075394 RepID=UPI002AD59357|nr:hypothetical protein [Nostoc sp. DedQUE09]MDZ7952538.1 hypothetical protein [Nostoc sp. DedQUE09]